MHNIQLYLSPESWRAVTLDQWGDSACVVVDVLRATSTLTMALAHGARQVLTVDSVEKAESLHRHHPGALLMGERHHLPLPGFDLGNSPGACTRDRVQDRDLIMTTTNGTPAIEAFRTSRSMAAACFLNLDAVAQWLESQDQPWSLVAAGWQGGFGLDDALVISALLDRLQPTHPWAALYRSVEGNLLPVLENTVSGRRLQECGLREDIVTCAQLNVCNIVPVRTLSGGFVAQT